MKKDMSLEGLRWSCNSGSALYDTPPNGRSRTGWGGVNCLALAMLESVLVVVLCVVLIKIIDINKYLNLIFFGK